MSIWDREDIFSNIAGFERSHICSNGCKRGPVIPIRYTNGAFFPIPPMMNFNPTVDAVTGQLGNPSPAHPHGILAVGANGERTAPENWMDIPSPLRPIKHYCHN